MLQKYAVHFQFATLVLLVMLTLIVSLTASTATKVNASPDAQVELAAYATFTCTPSRVAAFTNRVHIRCSAATPEGISYFAVSSSDSGTASRFLSIFTTAKVTGKNVLIYYFLNDTSGNAWGCNANDCRVAQGAEILP